MRVKYLVIRDRLPAGRQAGSILHKNMEKSSEGFSSEKNAREKLLTSFGLPESASDEQLQEKVDHEESKIQSRFEETKDNMGKFMNELKRNELEERKKREQAIGVSKNKSLESVSETFKGYEVWEGTLCAVFSDDASGKTRMVSKTGCENNVKNITKMLEGGKKAKSNTPLAKYLGKKLQIYRRALAIWPTMEDKNNGEQ
jgi:hypothetical protein